MNPKPRVETASAGAAQATHNRGLPAHCPVATRGGSAVPFLLTGAALATHDRGLPAHRQRFRPLAGISAAEAMPQCCTVEFLPCAAKFFFLFFLGFCWVPRRYVLLRILLLINHMPKDA